MKITELTIVMVITMYGLYVNPVARADETRDETAPRLLAQVEIGGRAWPLDRLPPGLKLDRELGVVVSASIGNVQAVGPYYPYGTIFGPRAVKAPNGDYLVFGAHGGLYFSPEVPANHAMMWRSTDGGATWGKGVQPWRMPDAKEHCIVPFIDPSEPNRIYTMGNASPDSKFTADVVLRYSDDNGHTWTERGRWSKNDVPQKIAGFRGGPVHMRGAVLGDGTWLWGVYDRDGTALKGDRQFVIRSTDKGVSWTLHPEKGQNGWYHPNWNKFMEGSVVANGGRNATLYMRIPGGKIWEKRSNDSGLTWSDAQETPGLVHPDAPPMIFPFAGGKRLIAFIHNRYTVEHPHHYHPDRVALWFAVSDDAGRSWSEPRFIIAQAKVPHNNDPVASCDPDVSYVDLLVDGTALHLFVGDGQRRALHLRFSENDLGRFPTKEELGASEQRSVMRDGSFIWQAEDRSQVGMWTSGPSVQEVSDAAADGGASLLFRANAPGDFIEFTLPDVLPGRYTLEIRYKAHAGRGICRIEVGDADGSNRQVLGEDLDMRGDGFATASVGVWSLPRMGFRTVRMTVTKTPEGMAKLSFDSFRLVPNSKETLGTPASLRADSITANHCMLHWPGVEGATGYLIRRRGGKTDDWRVVGTPPANAQRFTAVGLCDETLYEFSICAFSPDTRSAWSPPVTVKTRAGNHQRRGNVLARAPGRIGEASMKVRSDGSILLYANYQDQIQDQGMFEIHGMTSPDNGETWFQPHPVLAEKDRSFMMPALLRLRSGVALFCYTERDGALTKGMRFCKRSTDGGMTWSDPIPITTNVPLQSQGLEFSLPTGPHDRLTQTSSGRVIFPVHFPWFPPGTKPPYGHALQIASAIYYSDDEGKTWTMAAGPLLMRGRTAATAKQRDIEGFWEPSIVEIAPGELLMYMRSNAGWYYEVRSHDDGTTWSPPTQSTFRAPLAPAKLVELSSGTIGIVYNGIMDYDDLNLSRRWDLATMVSRDGGSTWENPRLLEFADPHGGQKSLLYGYPSLLWNDRVLHLTYFGVVDGQMFNMLYQRLPADWFTMDPPHGPIE
jgi:predicted neuraminidase